ncbi:Integral membrane protein (PIN domain superfamily) [Legionella busanensis]|uniref:Integral membrane protein (PIN domain superfamily) n=1 Tax=Legionella busanensis TaxID=190655 RepID=A0A378JRM1_9GAMM|nr:hypothetical protein [Legionella busanensis]STX50782.1 Integral membrane protein (PIN domain superfamily) [Legionella busanensis]
MPILNFFAEMNEKKFISVELPNNKIQTILSEIEDLTSSENTLMLMQLIKQKRNTFLREIDTTNDVNKRNKLIRSYWHFSKTLEACLVDNKNAAKHLFKYYTSSDYRLISLDNHFPNQNDNYIDNQVNNLALGGTIFSLSALVLSSIALSVGFPVLGIIGISVAITVLMPSLFYLISEKLPKKNQALKAEIDLFKAAVHTDLSQSELTDIKADIKEEHAIMAY